MSVSEVSAGASAPRESAARWWFARTSFPLVTILAIAGALDLIGRGWPVLGATALAQALAFLVVLVCERIVPYHESWKHSKGDIRVDASHAITLNLSNSITDL